MCVAVLVKQAGKKDVVCETVGELADILGKRPIEVSPIEDRKNCLCGARFDELGAVDQNAAKGWTGGYEWPEYLLTLGEH